VHCCLISRSSEQAAHSAQDSLKLNQPSSSFVSFDSDLMASSSSNVVGVHYRVGKKIGEGSFGVIFEGTNLLNNQQVAIKFVRQYLCLARELGNSSSLLCIRVHHGGFHAWLTTRPFLQEPRKSDAPQLRDEYRTYKILVGCREYIKVCLSCPRTDSR
jgi:serine/threonine protein kinase